MENRTAGLNHRCGSLTLLLLTAVAALGLVATATFGIFGWLEVTNFDFLHFFLCHFIASFLFRVVCCCVVSGTERQLMPARNVLFWNQVIKANQFFFSALGPLIP
jgi:hypothetical protein